MFWKKFDCEEGGREKGGEGRRKMGGKGGGPNSRYLALYCRGRPIDRALIARVYQIDRKGGAKERNEREGFNISRLINEL